MYAYDIITKINNNQSDIFYLNNKVNQLEQKIEARLNLHTTDICKLTNKVNEIKEQLPIRQFFIDPARGKDSFIPLFYRAGVTKPKPFVGSGITWFIIEDETPLKPFTVDKTGVYEARCGSLVVVDNLESNYIYANSRQTIGGYFISKSTIMPRQNWFLNGFYTDGGEDMDLVKLIKECKFN